MSRQTKPPLRHRWRPRHLLATLLAVLVFIAGFELAPTLAQAQMYCLPNMAFSRMISSNSDRIFFQSNCGNTITQLTNEAGTVQDTKPKLSPDGTAVVFLRTAPSDTINGGKSYDIFIVPTTGGEAANLTDTPSIIKFGGDWSPDSQHVVYDAYPSPPNGQIFMINRDGTGTTQITSGVDANDASPCWALDGRIAFSRWQLIQTGFISNFFVMDADGSNLHAVTNTTTVKLDCAWTPDGNYLLYDEAVNCQAPDSCITLSERFTSPDCSL
jgi:Tol biopolymer transport system component